MRLLKLTAANNGLFSIKNFLRIPEFSSARMRPIQAEWIIVCWDPSADFAKFQRISVGLHFSGFHWSIFTNHSHSLVTLCSLSTLCVRWIIQRFYRFEHSRMVPLRALSLKPLQSSFPKKLQELDPPSPTLAQFNLHSRLIQQN